MNRLLSESIKTLRLALPMVLGKLGPMLMHVADALMVAQLGVLAFSACAFGGTFVSFWLVCGMGICSAVHVCVSQVRGEGKPELGLSLLKHSLWLALLYGGFWSIVIYFLTDVLYLLKQPVDVTVKAESYIIIMTWASLPVYAFECLKNYYESCNKAWLPLWITVVGLVINFILNWGLIFGYMGFPRLELVGAGIATFLSRLLMFFILTFVFLKEHKQARCSVLSFFKVSYRDFKTIAAVAIPSTLHLFFERGFFCIILFMAGWLGKEALAAHHIAMTYVSLTLMIPFALSFATTVRVGERYGARDAVAIREIGLSSIITGTVFMALLSWLTLLFREPIISWFVEPGKTFEMALAVFVFVAVFQTIQGFQLSCVGVLKGMGDVKFPSKIIFVGYWIVSLPIAYTFAFILDFGLIGLWWGTVVGVSIFAVVFILRGRFILDKRNFK